eukprot:scaffold135148_cov88-Phaeocystis_antarctica.AAC.1
MSTRSRDSSAGVSRARAACTASEPEMVRLVLSMSRFSSTMASTRACAGSRSRSSVTSQSERCSRSSGRPPSTSTRPAGSPACSKMPPRMRR